MLEGVHLDRDATSDDVSARASDGLLLRVAAGDQNAFGELYDALAGKVFGAIRRLLIDPAQSEEVAQEVFLEVWQSATRFDPNKGGASTWIVTMAKRRAIDRIRSAQSARDRETRVGVEEFVAEYDDVAETAEIAIERGRVSVAMKQLSDAQRQVISLAYDSGYSHSEIAELIGVPIGTVKTRLRDGMIRLRTIMGVTT